MKSEFNDLTKFERFQAAVKIQRAWKSHKNTCPYCYIYGCRGIYSQFNCREMWDQSDLIKLDIYIDRFNG